MRTLTRTTSEDSVIALTILLLFIHLFFHDYGYLSTSTTKLTGAVSLSAAMIAAVLVASRLHDDHEAVRGFGVDVLQILAVGHTTCLLNLQLALSFISQCLFCLQFAHILLALELFLLSPFVRRSIRGASQAAHIAVTFFMLAVSISLAASLSQVAAVLVLTSALLLSFVCPVFLTRLNRFKAKIGGPWVRML